MTEIPDKLYFKIGEVSAIAELPPYVLRFWETEFTAIAPRRTASGQRLYRRSDVETILQIKDLLHEKKYTIQGAKQLLRRRTAPSEAPSLTRLLAEVRRELNEIRGLLD